MTDGGGRGGPHRLRAPGETWALAAPHLRAAGVTRLADLTGLDVLGVPVAMAVRPLARSLSTVHGKGLTPALARASAAMEALEIAAAERAAPDLAGVPAADLARAGRAVVPLRLPRQDGAGPPDPEAPAAWSRARDLEGGSEVLVPFDLVHLDMRPAALAAGAGFVVSSNGLASGNSRAEALLHALCEAVERDAQAVATRGGTEDPPAGRLLDPGSVPAGPPRALLARLEAAAVEALAWDITGDLGVPAVYARLVERGGGPAPLAPPADGAGCHPDPGVALLRALTEAVQTRAALISGARDDLLPRHYGPAPEPGPRLAGARPLAALPDLAGPDVAAELAAVLAALRAAGLCPLAVDLPAPPGLAVVRAIVPGLEAMPMARGYAAGPRALAGPRAT